VASSQRPCRASATVVSPMFTDRRGDVGSGWPRDSRQGRADSRSSDPSPCFRRFAGRRLRDRSRVRTRQQRGARRLSSCTGCGRWHQEVAEVAAMMAVPRGRGSLPLSEKTIPRALGELLPSVPHVRSASRMSARTLAGDESPCPLDARVSQYSAWRATRGRWVRHDATTCGSSPSAFALANPRSGPASRRWQAVSTRSSRPCWQEGVRHDAGRSRDSQADVDNRHRTPVRPTPVRSRGSRRRR
jgi:hypothetical protein